MLLPVLYFSFHVWLLSLGLLLFPQGEEEGGVNLGKRRDGELAGVEGGKLLRMYCTKEGSIFNKNQLINLENGRM